MFNLIPCLDKLWNLNEILSAGQFLELADMKCDTLKIISEWEANGMKFVLNNGEKMFSSLEIMKYYGIPDPEQRINWSQ